jgi:hypothetical protein
VPGAGVDGAVVGAPVDGAFPPPAERVVLLPVARSSDEPELRHAPSAAATRPARTKRRRLKGAPAQRRMPVWPSE